jgi:hypothetical protein
MNYETGWIQFFVPPSADVEIKVIYLIGVVNGDLISPDKDPDARFTAGTFDNALGTLSQTNAYFFITSKPVDTTYGPGILANVTFTVVGYGTSDITLGIATKLIGYTDGGNGDPYEIINARLNPDHIQHGYFSNLIPGDIGGDTPGSLPDGDVDRYDFGVFAGNYGRTI